MNELYLSELKFKFLKIAATTIGQTSFVLSSIVTVTGFRGLIN